MIRIALFPNVSFYLQAWKKRWFVLRSGRLSGDPNVLEYFRHQGSKKPIRAISLDECSQVRIAVFFRHNCIVLAMVQ